MKIIRNLLAAVLLQSVGACTPSANITTNNASVTILNSHRTVAILPFEIVFINDVQKVKKLSDEEMKQLNQYFSLALQKHLSEKIMAEQKRFPFKVTFQSPDETNQLLSSNKISFGAIFNGSKQEFCKILNTDAVITPQALFGIKESVQDITSGGKLQMRFSVFDKNQPAVAWSYNRVSNNLYNKSLTNKYLLSSPPPQAIYGSDDKFERIMLPWTQAIDELFVHFIADCPYKKKNNL